MEIQPQTTTTQREIYLLYFPSPLFPAHWVLYTPLKGNKSNKINDKKQGKYIQATGNALSGFELEFVRNYDLDIETRRYQLISLGFVDEKYIVDFEDGDDNGNGDGNREGWIGVRSEDRIPIDEIERVAARIPTPGKSLKEGVVEEGTKTRVEIQNCQTWLRELVVALVEAGIMQQVAICILDQAPKN